MEGVQRDGTISMRVDGLVLIKDHKIRETIMSYLPDKEHECKLQLVHRCMSDLLSKRRHRQIIQWNTEYMEIGLQAKLSQVETECSAKLTKLKSLQEAQIQKLLAENVSSNDCDRCIKAVKACHADVENEQVFQVKEMNMSMINRSTKAINESQAMLEFYYKFDR